MSASSARPPSCSRRAARRLRRPRHSPLRRPRRKLAVVNLRARRIRTIGTRVAVSAAAALAAAVAAVLLTLSASLPRRGGDAAVPRLEAPVRIELDERAVPRIRAGSLSDAFRAQGFLHAQERFFQMDLMRRRTAGELSALIGEATLPLDLDRRAFQFRRRAEALAARLKDEHRDWLEAYADGVNAGLADLGSRPPEYWLLGARPEPWTVEDSLLVVFAFYTMLSSNEDFERAQAVMAATLPASVYEFLTPSTSRFDRPLVGADASDPTGGYRAAAIPPATALDAVRPVVPTRARPIVDPPLTGAAASNQWAAGPSRTAGGAAIVANDPHLGLGLPNVFYRSELLWPDGAARGVGIPGVPGIMIGATDDLAWGVTVAYADQSDWVVVETQGADRDRYRVPDGTEPFVLETERIRVRGRNEPVELEVRKTRWGPVVERDGLGRPLALRATWLEPDGIDLEVLELMLARSVAEGVETLSRWEGPALNWMLVDTAGETGWIANGPLPERSGFDGSSPQSWADGSRGWIGRQAPPTLLNPQEGVLFTANNRTLPADAADGLGRMWMRPLRAKRIAELLSQDEPFDEAEFLAMQLDTRAEGYELIRDIALEALPPDEPDRLLASVRDAVARWNGRADAEQSGFRLLHVFYRALLERVLSPLLTPALEADPDFVYRWPLADEPLRRLLEERPPHLLPAGFEDWRDFLRRVLVDAVRELEADPTRPDAAVPWGRVNRLDAGHPMAALPGLGRWLRLEPVPQPGSSVSVRVATPSRGAVIRMVVSPQRPEAGVLQMSGGQSGHFLSRNFRDQQPQWESGGPAPFLAAETVDRFTLTPAAAEPARAPLPVGGK